MLLLLLVSDPGGPRAAVRDRLADAVAIALALLYGATMMLLGDAMRPGAAIPWPADLALGVLGAAALLFRRRHPLAVLLALLPLGAVSVTATGPVLVALFTAAIRLRFPLVLALGAVNLATGGLYFVLQQRPAYDVWVDFVVRGVITTAALGWGSFVRAYRRLTTSLREHAARLEADRHLGAERARLAERARIAREMHDVLAHRMSLISLHAGALEVRAALRPEELRVAAGAIRTGAHEALEELRAVVGVPRGRPEPPQPGLADVADLVASVRAAGMRVGFDSTVPAGAPVVLGRTAYRIVQEGLTNARRHGSEPAATVRMAGAAGRGLRITIINPIGGTPDPAPPRTGLGLVGIGERVALAGGEFRYGAERDVFRLEAELPWPA
ncbi:histidine kinase [Actinoplanes sp. SE50]|uniref:sensor histidine kinase n=1 Tax=unclassified Actinoplanes TaxID=2626549 RepID=UPI00023ED2B0|nr:MULTISPECIES: histidine kinase [unclassified Actinoplanes]AEV86150.1 Sensor protein kinase walK [Actinoplanes sp. SE50/110]ATO84548.1 histidine kinase [Actinoplanes sp. SE50]SLM01958.1 two-component system sensor kinase [Actinoplanes sp. SE50/110]